MSRARLTTVAVIALLWARGITTLASDVVLEPIGVFQHTQAARRGAEIVAYDSKSHRLFVTNGTCSTLDVLDVSDPSAPQLLRQIPVDGDPTHVACRRGIVAVSVAARERTNPGNVMLLQADGPLLATVPVAPLPDMLIFSTDGTTLLVANEGEPADDYQTDPEGAVTLIELDGQKPAGFSVSSVTRIGFERQLPTRGPVRVSGPGASPAQDYEPEYIGLSPRDDIALVTLQENNAFAKLDLKTRRFSEVISLGSKSFETDGLDASDVDGVARIAPWPVQGWYQPDGTAAFSTADGVFFITANEGDVRSYGDFDESVRVSELTLDSTKFPRAAELQREDRLGRLVVSRLDADTDGDGDADRLVVFGGRSFAVWDVDGRLVYDSGSQIEQYIAEHLPEVFNSQHDPGSFDSRSDDRGPEPEGVAVGQLGDRVMAFIGLERVSGIVVADVTQAAAPRICSIFHGSTMPDGAAPHPRDDQAPEGQLFIPAADSPTGKPLLVVAYEVSGNVRLYNVVVRGEAQSRGPD